MDERKVGEWADSENSFVSSSLASPFPNEEHKSHSQQKCEIHSEMEGATGLGKSKTSCPMLLNRIKIMFCLVGRNKAPNNVLPF